MEIDQNKNLLEIALGYLKRGWSVFPVGADKRPVINSWAEYQKRLPSEEEIKKWFSSPSAKGIAIATGSISGIVVLDIDQGANITSMDLPDTFKVKTGGGGLHYYFKYPKDKIIKNSAGKIGEYIDIRGDGGCIIAPPSLHQSGNRYEWLEGFSPDKAEIAEIPKWLLDRIELVGIKKQQDLKNIIGGVNRGGRNESATVVVGKLLSYLPTSEWEALGFDYLSGWNRLNNPPLPHNEIRAVFESIANRELLKRGASAKRERTKPLSVEDVFSMKLEAQPFLVDKLVPERGMIAFSGYPESGKSWITLYIAHCIATGQPVFGKFAVKQGGVLMIDEEAGHSEFHKRMKLLGFKSEAKIYLYSQEEFKVDNKDDIKYLVDTAKNLDVKLVIFDPFSAIHSRTENNAEEMQRVMEALQQFNLVGIAVIFIHHHRKEHFMVKNAPASMGLRGSTVLFARVDCHVAIRKDKETEEGLQISLEQAKLRKDQKFKPFTVELKIDKEKGVASFAYTGEVKEKLVKKEEAKEFILETLQSEPPIKMEELIISGKEKANVGKTAIDDAVKEMIEEKTLIREKIKGKGNAWHFSLPKMISEDLNEPIEQKLLTS